MASGNRPSWIEVDLQAIAHNLEFLRDLAAPSELCFVVKADGYGHGAVPIATKASELGITRFATATVDEAVELRQAGLRGQIIVLGEPTQDAMKLAAEHDIEFVVFTPAGIFSANAVVSSTPLRVHIKIDSGMNRSGVRWDEVSSIVPALCAAHKLDVKGLASHFACSDDFFQDKQSKLQIERFEIARTALAAEGFSPRETHICNSGGAIRFPSVRHTFVRCGIATYGLVPDMALVSFELPDGSLLGDVLRPVLSVHSQVSRVHTIREGEGISYGFAWKAPRDTTIATMSIGYADGIRRDEGAIGGFVLIRGIKRYIVGRVTMDQLMVDCGPNSDVAIGDEVVLIGEQGSEKIGAWDVAERRSTVAYEVVCSLGSRLPRRYV